MKNLGQVTENQDIARKQDIPTNTNQLTNGAGFITSSAISGKVDKIASTDNAIARFDGTGGAIQNSKVTITDAGKIVAPSFASDTTEAGMVFSDNNELNFGSNSNTLYIGYRNKLNTSGSVGIYNFGTSSGSTGMTSGRINAGDIYSNGTKVATISDLSGYVPTSRTINGKALSGNISLTASDVGALPSSTTIPTVNNATLTIQKNGTNVQTFTANQSTNVTANITVPTKTSELTNDSGFITSAPVVSVNNKTGAVTLTANDVGALPSSTEIPKIYYGTSSTAATTAEKVVDCADFLSLEVGAIITVRFAYGNASMGAKLNVNSTGAKSIRYRNAFGWTSSISWEAYDSLTFRYSGTYWDIIGNIDTNTTYTLSSFGITATSTELNYCDGVTSNIQTQLDAKANTSAIPTTTSQLTNDSGFITSADLPSSVTSVVGQTGVVTATDIKSGIQTLNGGFSIGYGSINVTTGGAIGYGSQATTGGSIGTSATCTTGGAVGASTIATTGFAGGNLAQATQDGAVQLGAGVNSNPNTLQFRSYQLLDAYGKIPAARFVESGSETNVWYEKFSNGLMICYGHKTYNRTNNATQIVTAVSFPQPFIDTNYVMQATAIDTSTNNYHIHGVNIYTPTKTASSCSIMIQNTNSSSYHAGFDWLAIGKWK